MKILKIFGKNISSAHKITPETYYLDVDSCPLVLWRKCYEVGYSSIRKDQTKGNDETDVEAYEILYASFVERVGLDDSFVDYINNMKAYVLATSEYLKSTKTVQGVLIHDRSKLLKMRILLASLQKFEKDGDVKVSHAKILNRLSKMQGYRVDEKVITVLEYFELIKMYKEWVKG